MISTRRKFSGLKHALFLIVLTVLVITMSGCVVEVEQTEILEVEYDQPLVEIQLEEEQNNQQEEQVIVELPDILNEEKNLCLHMTQAECQAVHDCQEVLD